MIFTFYHFLQGPTFDLSISSDTTTVFPWETVKMECDVSVSGTSPTAGELHTFLSHQHTNEITQMNANYE